MTTIAPRRSFGEQLAWVDLVLALAVAGCYVLIGARLLDVGNLAAAEQPAPIIFTAAGCYVLGGLLILLRRRWLLIVGASINALVMLAFVSAYLHRPAVLFSAGGLASKVAQLLLEVGLVALLVLGTRRAQDA